MKMNIVLETISYNEKRYGKPWVAKVTFGDDKKPKFSFGDWIGDAGCAGQLEITASAGDVISKGQKDHRNSNNNVSRYFIVGDNGSLNETSKVDAYKHCKNSNPAPSPLSGFTIEQLKAELGRRETA